MSNLFVGQSSYKLVAETDFIVYVLLCLLIQLEELVFECELKCDFSF